MPGGDSEVTGAENPFDMDRSWLIIERGADSRLVPSVGVVLTVVTFVTFTAAALAVLGFVVNAAWLRWPPRQPGRSRGEG